MVTQAKDVRQGGRQQTSMGSKLLGLARLARPANIITAHADIFAGYAAAAVPNANALAFLLLAATGLYGGGVVFNDVFDAALDARERPERPIPSGAVSISAAAVFGALLIGGGVFFAWSWSSLSGLVAAATAAAAVIYDRFGKHYSLLGPINMGLCRALNLLLGITAAGHITPSRYVLAMVPLAYIAGITSLSRGEVKGGTRAAARISAMWLAATLGFLCAAAVMVGVQAAWCLPFVIVLLFRFAGPFHRAFRTLAPSAIGFAVKTGILSLILLDASLAAIFAGPWYAVGILLLYLPATLLARLFAVT
jgi:4-hydroxybenzoate polyprenyltransferase